VRFLVTGKKVATLTKKGKLNESRRPFYIFLTRSGNEEKAADSYGEAVAGRQSTRVNARPTDISDGRSISAVFASPLTAGF